MAFDHLFQLLISKIHLSVIMPFTLIVKDALYFRQEEPDTESQEDSNEKGDY